MQHLFRRGDFFYFSRRIPVNLRKYWGYQKEIRFSLGTTDRQKVRPLLSMYDSEWEKLRLAVKMRFPEEVIKSYFADSPLFRKRETLTDSNFSELTTQFLSEKKASIRPDGIETFQAVFKEFTDILKDRHVQSYSHGDLIRFREEIGKKGIKPTTINKKIRYLGVFFNWGMTHGYLKINPCQGLTIRKQQPDHELKKIFTPDDIDRWFASPAFTADTCRNYGPQYFWIPLVGLLGLRINEICQLRTDDIKELDGVWGIDVNTQDGKKIKTLSSARFIPLPKFILEIGFLEYRKKRQNAGETQLFPIKFVKGNRPDYNYQVRRYIRKYVTKDEKKSFHSFRATLATMLKNLGARETIPEALIAQILGHANSSITMGRYGKPYSPAILLEALNKVDYKIDVEGLKGIAGSFLAGLVS